MSKWFRIAWLGRVLIHRADAVVVCASLLLGAAAPAALADDGQPREAADENSVLVATREAAPADAASTAAATAGEDSPLEPTSQFPERTPELAEPEKQSAGWQSRQAQPRDDQSRASETREEQAIMEQIRETEQPPAKSPAADEAKQFGAALAEVARSRDTQEALPNGRRSGGHAAAVSARELVPYEPAKFQGMQPGKSTREELLAAWGKPADAADTSEGTVLTYDIEPFQAVDVLVSPDGVIAAMKITLTGSLDPKALAKQLSLEEFEAVTIADKDDQPLGQAFPERGVVLMFDSAAADSPAAGKDAPQLVSLVAIQALDARAFALRAENHLHGPYENNVRDLKTAISLDSSYTHARWLLAEIYLATGQADLAEAEATAALEQEPTNAAYKLRHGQTLVLLGQYDNAVHEIRSVLDQPDTSPVVRAQAMHEMARLASIGDAEIAVKAISFDTRAIEQADQLATSDDVKERRAAKRLLIEAHLSIAEEIARQSFGDKVDSLQQWIGRASGLAEDYIAREDGSVELRLFVAQRALAALASFKPTLDPAPWVAEAEEAATALKKQSDDELWQQQIAWEIGQVYLHALRTEHLRRDMGAALRYGQLAIENLAEGAKSRQAVHSAEQQVGQLYFHVGAVYAVHQQDHKKAVAWYDKAAPLLAKERPASELYSPRRDGEMLVSMGVSYWQTGNQAKALELTQAGAKLVEAAVEDGILAKSSLAVPYGNLATMYQQAGENANAAKYANLAKAVGADAKPAARTGRSATPITPTGRTGMLQTSGQQQASRPATIIRR
jgi:hypothetical protein